MRDRFVSTVPRNIDTSLRYCRTLAEVRRVLRPGGRLHIADWGRPHGPLTALLARSIALLDGREQTADNLAGRLPELLEEAGFEDVRPGDAFRTIFGSLRLLAAARPASEATCGTA